MVVGGVLGVSGKGGGGGEGGRREEWGRLGARGEGERRRVGRRTIVVTSIHILKRKETNTSENVYSLAVFHLFNNKHSMKAFSLKITISQTFLESRPFLKKSCTNFFTLSAKYR